MLRMHYSFVPLCLILFNTEAIVSGLLLSPPPRNLSCYQCTTLKDGSSCQYLQLNNTKNQVSCKPNQMFCTVVVFQYSTDSSEYWVWSYERRCEETCHEGCNLVGERVKLFLCRSCCTDYLCNYGSGVSKVFVDIFYYLFLLCVTLYTYTMNHEHL